MPEFYVSEAKTAKITLRNPTGKAFGYLAALIIGLPEAARSEASVSIPAGAEKTVSFPITMPSAIGTYPLHVSVSSGDKTLGLYRATEDVTVVANLVKIYLTSPKYNPTNWYAALFDVNTRQFVPAVSGGGLSSLDTPSVFDIPPGPYLLYVHEFTMTGGWWLGPYLADIPAPGTYTWNSVAETLNTVKLTGLAPLPAGRVWGLLQSVSYEPSGPGAGWLVQLLIHEATAGSAAQYFVGASLYIKDADMPRYGDHNSIIRPGSIVTGTLSMYWHDASYSNIWRLRDVTYPLEYPSSAYVFSGSIARHSYGKAVISVSGNVSPFRVVKITRDPTNPEYPQAGWWPSLSVPGPVTGYIFDDSYIEGDGFIHQLWAHPNPNKVYDAVTAGVNHWVKVAEIRT